MDFGRNLPIPGALVSCLLLSIFLFWVTGQINYPSVGQVAVAQSMRDTQEISDAKNPPLLTSFVKVLNIIISLGGQNQVSHQNEVENQETGLIEENQSSKKTQEYSECAVSQRFPDKIVKWCDLITQSAQDHGIDPNLLAALIWQESGGNPQAYSRDGAVGLMQVMPRDGVAATFQCSNGPCFGSRPTINQLKDPDFNVTYGTKMLSGLITRRGSIREALKSYGPAGVGYSYADKVIAIYQRYGE
jgi:hypothetical protein